MPTPSTSEVTPAQRRRRDRKKARAKLARKFPHTKECDALTVEGIGPWPACVCGATERRKAVT